MQQTHHPDPTQPNGLGWFLGVGGLAWFTNFFNSRLGWIQVIRFTNPPNPTRSTYILYIFKILKIY